MIHTNQQIVGPSPQSLLAPRVFSTQLLPGSESSVTANSCFPDEKVKFIEIHANQMTAILQSIEGYSHDGLNE